MKNNKANASRNISILMLGTVILKFVSFLTAPVLSNIIKPSEYGLLSSFLIIVSILQILITLQTPSSIINAYLEFEKDQYEKFYNNIILLITLISAFLYLLIIVILSFRIEIIFLDKKLLLVTIPICWGQGLTSSLLTKLTTEKKAIRYVALEIINTLLITFSALTLAYVMQENPHLGYAYGLAIVNFILGIIIISWRLLKYKCFRNNSIKYNLSYALKISSPMIVHSLSSLILLQSDRYFLLLIKGSYSAGIYSMSYNIANITAVIWAAINSAIVPFLFEYFKSGTYETLNAKIKNLNTLITTVSIGFLLVYPEVIKTLLADTYWEGIKIIPIIVVSNYFIHLYSFSVNFEHYKKKTKYIAFGTILAALSNIILNIILVPRYDIMGSSYASLLSYFLLFVYHYISSKYIIGNYPIRITKLIPNFIALLMSIIIIHVFKENIFIRWTLAFICGLYGIYHLYRTRGLV